MSSAPQTQLTTNPAPPSPHIPKMPTKIVHRIKAHATEINGLRFNAAGSLLFSASSDATIRAWNTTSGRVQADYRSPASGSGHQKQQFCVDLSTDEAFLVGASADRICRIWNTATGKLVQNLTGHQGKVYKYVVGYSFCISSISDKSNHEIQFIQVNFIFIIE